MAIVKLAPKTILKHFMQSNHLISADDDYWENAAKINHQQHGTTESLPENLNTLLLLKPCIWKDVVSGSYFGDRYPPIISGELVLTIESQCIDRVITTKQNGITYQVIDDLVGNSIVDTSFICNYDSLNQIYTIVYFEEFGNPIQS